MSKFTDRLKRLHSSRVRALEESEDSEQSRVFTADAVEEVDVKESAPPAKQEPRSTAPVRTERPASPARDAVRERLELSQRVGRRKPTRLRMERSRDTPEPTDFDEPSHPAPAEMAPIKPEYPSENAIGERLTDLRIQGRALIEAGRIESALPLLNEMVALSPTHPFALKELARYWRSVGNHAIADLYEGRLAAAAPY